jgi:hypothetical protein
MSGLILAVLVAIWAAVLVPMWLRRREQVTESRSVDRFAAAMRILSRRRPSTPDRRYVLMPRRGAGSSSWPTRLERSCASAVQRVRRAVRRQLSRLAELIRLARAGRARRMSRARSSRQRDRVRAARSTILRRRRRILAALAGFVVLTGVLTGIGLVRWPVQLAADVALVGWLAHLRAEVRRSAAMSRRRRALARSRQAAHPQPGETGALGSDASAGPAANDEPASPAPRAARVADEAPLVGDGGVDETVLPPAAKRADADAAGDPVEGRVWNPVPVPPPAYTLRPPAFRRDASDDRTDVAAATAEPATIDLTALGLWADEREVRQSLLHAEEEPLSADEPEIDELLERRRAVGS